MRYDPQSFRSFDRLAYQSENLNREPVFKGKFLVCVRHCTFQDTAGDYLAFHDEPEKDFADLEQDEFILFSRN